MAKTGTMITESRTARLAGVFYLIVVLTGIFNLGILPSKFLIKNDPLGTFDNIVANLPLFKYWILAGIVCYIAFLLLPLVLYKLLAPINKNYAVAMVALAVVSIPITFAAIPHQFTVLTLLERSHLLTGMELTQLKEEIMYQLYAYNSGIKMASIFWGLWLFPFGLLVYKSGFLPKILGILLMFGCFGYLVNFFGYLFFDQYAGSILSKYITKPGSIGEIGICLWLLIVGIQQRSAVASA